MQLDVHMYRDGAPTKDSLLELGELFAFYNFRHH